MPIPTIHLTTFEQDVDVMRRELNLFDMKLPILEIERVSSLTRPFPDDRQINELDESELAYLRRDVMKQFSNEDVVVVPPPETPSHLEKSPAPKSPTTTDRHPPSKRRVLKRKIATHSRVAEKSAAKSLAARIRDAESRNKRRAAKIAHAAKRRKNEENFKANESHVTEVSTETSAATEKCVSTDDSADLADSADFTSETASLTETV